MGKGPMCKICTKTVKILLNEEVARRLSRDGILFRLIIVSLPHATYYLSVEVFTSIAIRAYRGNIVRGWESVCVFFNYRGEKT